MASEETPPAPVLVLCRDLMFTSKITASARAVGVAVRVVRDPAHLPEGPAPLLLVDLALDGAIPAAAAWKQGARGRIIGFAPHVDTGTIAAAREAGLDQVMTRGQFSAGIDQILAGH